MLVGNFFPAERDPFQALALQGKDSSPALSFQLAARCQCGCHIRHGMRSLHTDGGCSALRCLSHGGALLRRMRPTATQML